MSNRFENCYNEFELNIDISKVNDGNFNSRIVKRWFGSTKYLEKGYNFLCFGENGTGGLYCFWVLPDSKELPVVWLSGEGVGTFVIAKDFESFLQFLADRKWYNSETKEFSKNENFTEKQEADYRLFAEWLTKEQGVPFRPAEVIISEAETAYPNAYRTIIGLC